MEEHKRKGYAYLLNWGPLSNISIDASGLKYRTRSCADSTPTDIHISELSIALAHAL